LKRYAEVHGHRRGDTSVDYKHLADSCFLRGGKQRWRVGGNATDKRFQQLLDLPALETNPIVTTIQIITPDIMEYFKPHTKGVRTLLAATFTISCSPM